MNTTPIASGFYAVAGTTFHIGEVNGRNGRRTMSLVEDGLQIAFGWLHGDGTLQSWNVSCATEATLAAGTLLRSTQDAAAAAARYTALTGKCSDCGRVLTAHDSLVRGKGPVCSAKQVA